MEEFKFEEGNTPTNTGQTSEGESLGDVFSRKVISFIIGAIVVVVALSVGTYLFIQSRPTSTSSQNQVAKITPKASQNSNKVTVSPIPSTLPQNSPSPQQNGTIYTDSIFAYTIQIPKGWEVFKRVVYTDSYQIGIRPIGSTDVPLVISSQPNKTNESLLEWVNSAYGSSRQSEKVKVGKKDAILIKNIGGSYSSYITINAGNVYEIAVSLQKNEYLKTINQIITSLSFTR